MKKILLMTAFVFFSGIFSAETDTNPWTDKLNMVEIGMTKKEVEKILPVAKLSSCSGYGTLMGEEEYVNQYHLDDSWRVFNTYKWGVPLREQEHTKGKSYQSPDDKILKKPKLEAFYCGVKSDEGKGFWKGEHIINYSIKTNKEVYSDGDEVILTARIENISENEIGFCPDVYNVKSSKDLKLMDNSLVELTKRGPGGQTSMYDDTQLIRLKQSEFYEYTITGSISNSRLKYWYNSWEIEKCNDNCVMQLKFVSDKGDRCLTFTDVPEYVLLWRGEILSKYIPFNISD